MVRAAQWVCAIVGGFAAVGIGIIALGLGIECLVITGFVDANPIFDYIKSLG